MDIQSKLLYHTPVMGTHSSYQLYCLLEVSDKEECVVAVHLPIGPLKNPL